MATQGPLVGGQLCSAPIMYVSASQPSSAQQQQPGAAWDAKPARTSGRQPRHSLDMSLPSVGHLAEADWTRALTDNIKSVAQVHGALAASPYPYPGASMPGSPISPRAVGAAAAAVAPLGRRHSAMCGGGGATAAAGAFRRRQGSSLGMVMGTVGGASGAIVTPTTLDGEGMLFLGTAQSTAQSCGTTPLQRGQLTSSFDGVVDEGEDGRDSGMHYLADEMGIGDGGLPDSVPDVVPPALLAEAAKAGISLQVQMGTQVALSPDPPLGRGSSGTVLKALYNGQPCAVKMLPQDLLFGGGTAELHTFVQEVVVMAPLRHPNIVTFLGGSLQPPHVFLLAELCETSLDVWLHPRGGGGGAGGAAAAPVAAVAAGLLGTWAAAGAAPAGTVASGSGAASGSSGFSLWQVLKIALDVASGLEYLHGRSPAIVHRDLKPANVLIDANGTAKISDFGLARVKTSAAINTKAPEVGSVGYMAPECFTSEHGLLTDKCDTWSLGVILWEMVTRQRPFPGLTLTQYYREVVVRKSRPPIPQDDGRCPLALRRLISAMWADDPAERPSCGHIVAELTRMLKYCPRD